MARTRKNIVIGDLVKMTDSAKTFFQNRNANIVFEDSVTIEDIKDEDVMIFTVEGETRSLNRNFLERVI